MQRPFPVFTRRCWFCREDAAVWPCFLPPPNNVWCQNEMRESHGRPPASSPLVSFSKGPRKSHGFLCGAISTPIVALCILGHQVAISPDTENFAMNWMGQEVTGATLGIVGMGSIGYRIAQRAQAFDMKILYHNRRRRWDWAVGLQ